MATAQDRFWKKVERQDNGCWLWVGAKTPRGRPQLSVGTKMVSAYRLAYEWWKGPIPAGWTVDHLCGVSLCVNPQHLEACTASANFRRWYKPKTHCAKGHVMDDQNTRVYTDPAGITRRRCRACHVIHVMDRKRRLREAR